MGGWDWLGVRERRWRKTPDEEVRPGKTLWDVLEVAVIPTALVVIAFMFNSEQSKREGGREFKRANREAKHENDRANANRRLNLAVRQDKVVSDYLDRMSALVLDRGLLTSRRAANVRTVARVVTLTTLRRLDGERKGQVIGFLDEAGLVKHQNWGPAKVNLRDADLRGVVLGGHYERLSLREADLRGADFSKALLSDVDLRDADLVGANFSEAEFRKVTVGYDADEEDEPPRLSGADFTRANLAEVDLRDADLRGADLSEAEFDEVVLHGAQLQGASFHRAAFGERVDMTSARLDGARFDGAERKPVLGDVVPGLPGAARPAPDKVMLVGSCLAGASFVGAKLGPVDASKAQGSGIDFARADLDGFSARGALLRDLTLTGARGISKDWSPRGVAVPPSERHKRSDLCKRGDAGALPWPERLVRNFAGPWRDRQRSP